jgi:hypothetical protein
MIYRYKYEQPVITYKKKTINGKEIFFSQINSTLTAIEENINQIYAHYC